MAKLTKSVLKELLKECLKEILVEEGMSFIKEGTVNNLSTVKTHTHATPHANVDTRNLRSVQQATQEKENMLNEVMQEHVKTLSSALSRGTLGQKDDGMQNMFEEIFQDTAQTTLQEMRVHEGKAEPTAEMQAHYDDQNEKEFQKLGINNDNVSRWAKIAFSNKPKK